VIKVKNIKHLLLEEIGSKLSNFYLLNSRMIMEQKNKFETRIRKDSSLIIVFFSFSDEIKVLKPILSNNQTIVYNPYPSLGCPMSDCWPRGFPLNEIWNEETWKTTFVNSTTQLNSFGVLQSLSDIEPDVDAIFGMTQKTSFLFEKPQMFGNYSFLFTKARIKSYQFCFPIFVVKLECL
jgi:hypothetical protein